MRFYIPCNDVHAAAFFLHGRLSASHTFYPHRQHSQRKCVKCPRCLSCVSSSIFFKQQVGVCSYIIHSNLLSRCKDWGTAVLKQTLSSTVAVIVIIHSFIFSVHHGKSVFLHRIKCGFQADPRQAAAPFPRRTSSVSVHPPSASIPHQTRWAIAFLQKQHPQFLLLQNSQRRCTRGSFQSPP